MDMAELNHLKGKMEHDNMRRGIPASEDILFRMSIERRKDTVAKLTRK